MKNQLFSATCVVILCALLALPAPGMAWTNHTRLTLPVSRSIDQPLLKTKIPAESLADFLRAEADGLEKLLADDESFMRLTWPNYPQRPDTLAFEASKAGGMSDDQIRLAFLRAVRMNPDLKMPLFIYLAEGNVVGRQPISHTEFSVLSDVDWIEAARLVRVKQGEMLAATDVLSAASDEPDYGFDLGLYADNNTPQGAEYGYGNQAFGNPEYESSSQAPFHMAFFHEPWIINVLAGWVKRCNTEYRIWQFYELSRFAFKTGHDYWGLRFLGWALHYMQDLSFPYHTRTVPGISAIKLVWAQVLSMIGFPAMADELLTRVSDRHYAGENWFALLIDDAYSKNELNSTIFDALRIAKENQQAQVDFGPMYAREVTALRSAEIADELDDAIGENWQQLAPFAKLTADYATFKRNEQTKDLDKVYFTLMENFALATRALVVSALATEEEKP